MKKLLAALVLCLSPLAAHAQQAPGSAQKEKMKALDFLAGQWRGEGWAVIGPGQRRTFTIEETVQPKLGGLVLLVEGLGRTKDGPQAGAVSHNALATVAYDERAGQFRFRAYQMEGHYTDSEAKVGDRTLEWGFTDPRVGTIKFTIRVGDAGDWTEIGEVSRDAKTWAKFLEMTLRRVK